MDTKNHNTQTNQSVPTLEIRERELDEARAKVAEANALVRAKKQTSDNLRKVYDSHESRANRFVYQRDYLNQELRTKRKEIRDLEKQLEATKSEFDELTETTKEVRLTVTRATRNMKKSQADCDAADDELEKVLTLLEIAEKNLASAKEAYVKVGGTLPPKDKFSKVQASLRKSPWISGSFYLFAAVVVITLLAIISTNVPWYILPIVIGGGFLTIIIIGAFQLRNDENLSQENFLVLMKEAIRGMTLLGEKTQEPILLNTNSENLQTTKTDANENATPKV